MNSVKCVALLSGLLILTSCSIATKKSTQPINSLLTDSLIAQDFVNTMSQIESLKPWSTVLQFHEVKANQLSGSKLVDNAIHRFGNSLKKIASNSGYALRNAVSSTGPDFVSYSISEVADSVIGDAFIYDVSVGKIDFRRTYKILADGSVRPHKGMLIRGADISEIVNDGSIFNTEPVEPLPLTPLLANTTANESAASRNGFDSPVARMDRERQQSQALQERSVAVTSPINRSPTSRSPSQSLSVANTVVATTHKKNRADLGISNYDSLFANTKSVAEETLIFGDDSYVLGTYNKKILEDVMNSFNPETDVISLVGCSTGATKLTNGNAALAIGRANRVKEALLYSGIENDKILDEGCWSSDANSTPFPNRGVVVTVKRGAKKS